MNLNPPALRFPYDVLKEVILHGHMYTSQPEYDDPNILLQLPSPPIVASHVCRWWRYSLLSDTSVWTSLFIPQMKPDGILELLRRSGSAPLNVFLSLKSSHQLEYDNTSHMLFSLFQQIHRFRTLYVYVQPLNYHSTSILRANALQLWIRQVLPYFQRPAPELRTFFFSYSNDELPLARTFIDTLFSGDAPNLKHILHGLSVDLRELHCPLFHNLSELYLTLDNSMRVDFGLFLDLLALSPRLRLLHVYIDRYDNDVWVSFKNFTGRTISLPYMQSLVLEVNRAAELVSLILEHVTLPSNLKWRITSHHVPGFADSPAFLKRLSQARFISQHIRLTLRGFAEVSLEEEPGSSHINQLNHNKLVFLFEDDLDPLASWLIRSIESSRITHLNLVFAEWYQSGNHIIVSTILTSMTNLDTIDITESDLFDYRECLYCLSVLLPGQQLEPDLSDWVPVDIDATPTTPSFPCPVLREITIKTKQCLKETQAIVIRKFAEKRRERGYPLRILVQFFEIEESSVDSILQLQENGIFQVMIVPRTY